MAGNQHEQVPRHGCGRWTLALAFTIVFGCLILFQSADLPSSRILPLQDVVFKTAVLRSDAKSGKGQVSVTSDAIVDANKGKAVNDTAKDDKSSSTSKDGVPQSLSMIRSSELARESKDQGDGAAMKSDSPTSQGESPEKEEVGRQSTSDAKDKTETSEQMTTSPQEEEFIQDCSAPCLAHVQQHKERWGGDLLNITDVKRLVKKARDDMIAQFKVDYGEENYAKIFEVDGESRGRTAFVSAHAEDGVSIERFKRKLKMKILTMQNAIQAERESLRESSRRRLTEYEIPSLPDHYERFVWATGGHSAAAGHGNLFNESYTAFMNRAVSDVFGAIGIEFEGKNYAMGGTASAPEIALCSEAVFGTDADVISWDFAMTDANW